MSKIKLVDIDVGWGVMTKECDVCEWSFGVSLVHDWVETYISIDFYKWSVKIGRILKVKGGTKNE